jgi:hypothetical protein
MAEYQFTAHCLFVLNLPRRDVRPQWCIRVIEDPIRREVQPDGRIRFWAILPELGGRALRVVTLADGITILTAFPDRRFKP